VHLKTKARLQFDSATGKGALGQTERGIPVRDRAVGGVIADGVIDVGQIEFIEQVIEIRL
jgi:hypothetical protein